MKESFHSKWTTLYSIVFEQNTKSSATLPVHLYWLDETGVYKLKYGIMKARKVCSCMCFNRKYKDGTITRRLRQQEVENKNESKNRPEVKTLLPSPFPRGMLTAQGCINILLGGLVISSV